ncbi:cobalt ECF transporter T component CbiQ [Brooklawnia cerclae]|uniref:Cobalt/nickel transport system permease protein n=1 Tax=Brooklawnia cerclae TaxID=349934 RepID=A0ABX0SKB2_9ACTN|nr:cobalt ECF transporter T component CbiQ [Brooklawnia cerclae]NIH58805.1 cobalt/nickel transport system permease protein [Brooklawnia cerclae]
MAALAVDDAAWASPWRRQRVGDKLLLSLALIMTALVAPVVPGTVLVGVASAALILGPAHIRWSMLMGAMSAPIVFIALGAISVLLSVGASPIDPYWQWGFLSVTPTSVAMAGRLVLHALAGTLAVMVLALTTPMSDLLDWMAAHRVPGPLVEVASLTYRLLFIVWSTAVALHDTQLRRLGDPPIRSRETARLRWQATAGAVGTILVRSWDRARRLESGLAARGAEDSLATTSPDRPRDRRLAAGFAGLVAAIWTVCLAWVLVREAAW